MNLTLFLETFSAWARAQADIEGVALVGSHARDAATTDSDVDLVILTSVVSRYFQDQSWISQFGDVGQRSVEEWGRVKSLRVFYKAGPEIEYNFATPDWASSPVDRGTFNVVADGMKIVYDPQAVLGNLKDAVASGCS